MFFEQYSHEPNIAVASLLGRVRHEQARRRGDRGQARRRLPRARRDGARARGRDFLVGDGYTIADIALYAYTHVAGEGGFDLVGYPAILGWLERVEAEPGHVSMNA